MASGSQTIHLRQEGKYSVCMGTDAHGGSMWQWELVEVLSWLLHFFFFFFQRSGKQNHEPRVRTEEEEVLEV